MKNFFTNACAAFVGSFVGLILFSFISTVMTFVAIISLAVAVDTPTQTSTIEKNSVLRINLSGNIQEKPEAGPSFLFMDKNEDNKSTLSELLLAINNAAENKNIKGIFLNCKGVSTGLAEAYELRQALAKFKNSGKWIYSYGDSYGQVDYYIASVADSIYVNPEGSLEVYGLASVIPYFKNLLDKVGVEMQVFKVGTFKSAVEPYISNEMSDANRIQTSLYLGNMWNTLSSEICESRGIEKAAFNQMVDSMLMLRPVDYLLENKLVDRTIYAFDFVKHLKKECSIADDKALKFVYPSDLLKEKSKNNKIGVLYAEGEINSQADDGTGIVAKDMIEAILSAKDDDDIKGLVMRVNSPGGSAFDSEQIWAAFEEFKKSGKPFAVSMGDYAASGGYYISSGADRIFAEPVTLTGSIGIFGMIPNVKRLANDCGINFNKVSTNPDALVIPILEPMTQSQKASMQAMVARGYDLFTRRCAEGRKMTQDSIKVIAEGRVWDGSEALKIGLVDQIGNLKDALDWVAEQAGVTDYSAVRVDNDIDPLKAIFGKYSRFAMARVIGFGKYDYLVDSRKVLNGILNRDRLQAFEPIKIDF